MSCTATGPFGRLLLAASAAALMLAGCVSAPPEPEQLSYPLTIELNSQTVAAWPGLRGHLLRDVAGTRLELYPPASWGRPQMRSTELQTMWEHCAQRGREVIKLREARLKDASGQVVRHFPGKDGQLDPVTLAGAQVDIAEPEDAVLQFSLDVDAFHGEIEMQTHTAFRDAEAPVAPDLYATVESISELPQQLRLGAEILAVHDLFLRLHNRGKTHYSISGVDSGAVVAGSMRMLNLGEQNDLRIAPGEAVLIRLPIELGPVSLISGRVNQLSLLDYALASEGVVGPRLDETIGLRVQIGVRTDNGQVRLGRYSPGLEVYRTFRILRPGCFDGAG